MTVQKLDPVTERAFEFLVDQMQRAVDAPMEVDQRPMQTREPILIDLSDDDEPKDTKTGIALMDIPEMDPELPSSESLIIEGKKSQESPKKKPPAKKGGRKTKKKPPPRAKATSTGVSTVPSPAVAAQRAKEEEERLKKLVKEEPDLKKVDDIVKKEPLDKDVDKKIKKESAEMPVRRSCTLGRKQYRDESDSEENNDDDDRDEDWENDSEESESEEGQESLNGGDHAEKDDKEEPPVDDETTNGDGLLEKCQLCLELPFEAPLIPKLEEKRAHALVHLSPLPKFARMSMAKARRNADFQTQFKACFKEGTYAELKKKLEEMCVNDA